GRPDFEDGSAEPVAEALPGPVLEGGRIDLPGTTDPCFDGAAEAGWGRGTSLLPPGAFDGGAGFGAACADPAAGRAAGRSSLRDGLGKLPARALPDGSAACASSDFASPPCA